MQSRVLGVLAGATMALWSGGALAADGCGDGTWNTTVTPDAMSYSTLFSEWIAFAGDITTCAITVPISNTIPTGNIVVYTSDLRGFYNLEAGDNVEITVDQNGTVQSVTDSGPIDTDYEVIGDLVASSNGKVAVNGEVDLSDVVDPDDPDPIASVDSIDLNEVGRITTPTDQTAAIVHLGATAGLLTGGLQPLEGDDEVGILGGYGSHMFGATGHLNISEGFSVLGGISLISQTAGASTTGGVLGAASVRYVEPGVNTFRVMAEGGLVLGGLQTTYPNTTGPVATGLGTVFAKGGVVTDITPETQLAVYGTLAETALASDAFTQDFTVFTVDVPAQTGFFTTAKATAAVTTQLAPQVDLTAEVSAGLVMSHNGMTATIPGLGTVSGAQNSGFVDYGLRLGWQPDPAVRLELFSQGSAGQDIGLHNQLGASAKLKF